MTTKVMIQSTPNPNALKFVINKSVKTEGNWTYKRIDECNDNPLAKVLFELSASINEIFFFDNYITITQDGSEDWNKLEKKVQSTILEMIANHDPNFKTKKITKDETAKSSKNPELEKINAILDETIRPALQGDGGDLQTISYENNRLIIMYQGACGSCPSATMGTLNAIQNILRDRFNPEIKVESADMEGFF